MNQTIKFQAVSWWQIYKRLRILSGEYGGKFTTSMLSLFLASLAQGFAYACAIPLFSALIQHDKNLTIIWLLVFTLLTIVSSLLRSCGLCFNLNGHMVNVVHKMRTEIGKKLRQMPIEQLQQQRTGTMASMVLSKSDEALLYVVLIADLIFNSFVIPFTVAIVTLCYDWRLGLLILAVFPILIPLYKWQRPKSGKGVAYLNQALSELNANTVEYLQGMPILRSTGNIDDKANVLQQSINKVEQVQLFGLKKSSEADVIIVSILELSLLLIMLIGVYLVSAGNLELTILAAVMVSMVRFSELFTAFINLTKVLDVIEMALQHIEQLYKIEPLPQLSPTAKPDSFAIEFKQVSFKYVNANDNSINDVNLSIAANSMTALVGPSGSGKTTLTRLLMRHFDPQQGKILIGGVDVRQIPAAQLNNLISVVFQDVYLFNESIIDNIRMAKPDATDAQVQKVAKTAFCHDFIQRLPNGYLTKVDEIGGSLSGGEKQRISIARALLKDSPIVILDEPTAALDTESEYAVQQAINVLVKNRTVIVIAHRLSTIAGANNIVVLENGKISQQGKQQQLLAQTGRYQAMWQAQQQSKSWRFQGSGIRD